MAWPSSVVGYASGEFHKGANLASSTLSAAITGTPATFTVASATTVTTWPTATFVVRIENELIYCTSRSGTTVTIGSRGYGGTTSADHASAKSVSVVYTSNMVEAMAGEIIAIETYLAAGGAGLNAADNEVIAGVWDFTNGFKVGATTLFEADRDLAVPLIPNDTGTLNIGSAGRLFNEVRATTYYGNGANLTGITGASGGISNTGTTTIAADTDSDGVGTIALQTRTLDRLTVGNAGEVNILTDGASGGLRLGVLSDAVLFRQAPATLKTTGSIITGSKTTASGLDGPGVGVGADGFVSMLRSSAVGTAWFVSVAADANARLLCQADGKLLWGDGTLTQDTNLYRGAFDSATFLISDARILRNAAAGGNYAYALKIVGDTKVRWAIEGTGKMLWGSGSGTEDTVLYRGAANVLRTEDKFSIFGLASAANNAIGIGVSGDADERLVIFADGKLQWGNGATSGDTKLARVRQRTLALDENVQGYAAIGTTSSSNNGFLVLGRNAGNSTGDLYTVINTNSNVGGSVLAIENNGLSFYTAAGLNVTAGDAVNILRLRFDNAGVLQLPTTGSTGGLLIGGDANLYRSAANFLATDDNLLAGFGGGTSTTKTGPFLYAPTTAGAPTGTPTGATNMAPIVIDTTNNKIYFYSGGAWRDAGP